jgi:hypothetical protein
LVGIGGLTASLCITAPALAHHSFAAIFDSDEPVELTGTVTRIEWMNPHVWLYLDVKNEKGAVESWSFEMGSPNRLTRYGWHENSLMEGQVVTIAGSRSRDGSLKAAVNTVTLPNGERLFGAQETGRALEQ